jgi:thioredoxin-related protein
MNRRQALSLLLAMPAAWHAARLAAANAMAVAVPQAQDLAADAALARAGGMPLLLVFTAADCPYCERLKAEVIRPMLFSGQYDGRLLVREVPRASGRIIGTDGTDTDGRALAAQYRVRVVPAMVWTGPDGAPLADVIVGYNTPELFFGRVEAAQSQALRRLRQQGAG